MSRRGNCLDNAAMESWFPTLKFELGEHFEGCGAAKEELSMTSRSSTTSNEALGD